MTQQSGRIDYEPVIRDCWKHGDEGTISAGCAICWAGCLPRFHFGPEGNYPEAWEWMTRISLLTDEALICVDYETEEIRPLGRLPQPMRVGDLVARFKETEARREARRITRHAALPWYENYFLLTPESHVQSYDFHMSSQELDQPAVQAYVSWGTWHPHFYLPVHDACMHVLDQFLESQINSCKSQNGLADFYDSIHTAFEEWSIDNPHWGPKEVEVDFDEMRFRDRVGIRETGFFSFGELFLGDIDQQAFFFADPWDVTAYTQALIDDAPRLGTAEETTQFEKLLRDLPQELLDRILQDLCPLEGVAKDCNRLLSPNFWRDLLAASTPLPFLWDLDKDHILNANDAIDWELLVRQLALPDPFENFPSVPRGLRNRHSIWRSLEAEMIGGGDSPSNLDVAEQSSQDGSYTDLKVEWTKRTDEERGRWGFNADRDIPGGHWTVRWSRKLTPGQE